jgi:tRNA A22 N-methylase
MNIKVIEHILKNKWVYSITTIACILISLITYTSIPKEYSSIAYVFATNSYSPTKVLTEPNAGSQDDALRYGDKESIEQTLQLFSSNDIKLNIIKKYNLAGYWNVNETDAYKLFEKWDKDVKINITGLISIKIQVYNKDPKTANDMANSIIMEADELKLKLNQKTVQSTINILGERLKDELNAILNADLNLTNMDSAFAANRMAIGQKLSKNDSKKLLEIYYKYMDAKVNLNKSLPASFVISKPITNSGEQRPRFLLLLTIITLSTLVLEFFIISTLEKINNKSHG